MGYEFGSWPVRIPFDVEWSGEWGKWRTPAEMPIGVSFKYEQSVEDYHKELMGQPKEPQGDIFADLIVKEPEPKHDYIYGSKAYSTEDLKKFDKTLKTYSDEYKEYADFESIGKSKSLSAEELDKIKYIMKKYVDLFTGDE